MQNTGGAERPQKWSPSSSEEGKGERKDSLAWETATNQYCPGELKKMTLNAPKSTNLPMGDEEGSKE